QARKMCHIHFCFFSWDTEFGTLQQSVCLGVNRPDTMSIDHITTFVNTMHTSGNTAIITTGDYTFISDNSCPNHQSRTCTSSASKWLCAIKYWSQEILSITITPLYYIYQ